MKNKAENEKVFNIRTVCKKNKQKALTKNEKWGKIIRSYSGSFKKGNFKIIM